MIEISCSSCRDQLPLYAAGQLPGAARTRLAAHLAICPDCPSELAFWQAFVGALDFLDGEIPPDMDAATRWQALRHALPARAPVPSQRLRERVFMENTPDLPPSARAGGIPANSRASSRRRPLLALTAFVLIVALSATLFAFLSTRVHHGQHPIVAATPTIAPCSPAQMRVNLPPHASIVDISMISPRDGWAVGQIWDPVQATTPPKTLVARFHDCQWTAFGDGISAAELTSVSMGSASDGWAVGMSLKAETYQKPGAGEPINHLWVPDHVVALHYTGGAWQRASVPYNGVPVDARVRMVSSSAGWMLVHGAAPREDAVLRYASGTWSILPRAPLDEVAGIAAASPDDAWVAADQLSGTRTGASSLLARYHAGAWTVETVILGMLTDISFSSPTNGWAVGYAFTTANGPQPVPLILHYNGASWAQVQLPASLRGQIPGAALSSVSAISDNDIWMLGVSGRPGGSDVAYSLVLHYTNGQWTQVRLPNGVARPHDVAMYSATQGFAIGDSSVQGGVILLYDNGAWSVLPGQQP